MSKIHGLKLQKYNHDHSYFIFQIFFPSKKIRDKILLKFKKHNIGSSIHYATPVPLMTYYKNKYNLSSKKFPNAKKYGETGISLPVHQFITAKMIEFVSEIIIKNI